MKRVLPLLLVTVLLVPVPSARTCTNFPINIGAMDTPANRILVESLSLLINERTGVTVGIHYFSDWAKLDQAVRENRLEMTIEDTTNALLRLGKPVGDDPEQNLETLKQAYKSKKMLWLRPFAFTTEDDQGRGALVAPVITRKTLSQFPALPRLIRKLSKKMDDKALERLVENVKGSAKARNVGREFLIGQNLI